MSKVTMNSTVSRGVKRNIKCKLHQHKSLHTSGTKGWYIEDLGRCLHSKYKSFSDVKKGLHNKPGIQIHGVYIRHEVKQDIKIKLGKGIVEFVKTKKQLILPELTYQILNILLTMMNSFRA